MRQKIRMQSAMTLLMACLLVAVMIACRLPAAAEKPSLIWGTGEKATRFSTIQTTPVENSSPLDDNTYDPKKDPHFLPFGIHTVKVSHMPFSDKDDKDKDKEHVENCGVAF